MRVKRRENGRVKGAGKEESKGKGKGFEEGWKRMENGLKVN